MKQTPYWEGPFKSPDDRILLAVFILSVVIVALFVASCALNPRAADTGAVLAPETPVIATNGLESDADADMLCGLTVVECPEEAQHQAAKPQTL